MWVPYTRNVIPAGIVATARQLENDSFNFGILVPVRERIRHARVYEIGGWYSRSERHLFKEFNFIPVRESNRPHTQTQKMN